MIESVTNSGYTQPFIQEFVPVMEQYAPRAASSTSATSLADLLNLANANTTEDASKVNTKGTSLTAVINSIFRGVESLVTQIVTVFLKTITTLVGAKQTAASSSSSASGTTQQSSAANSSSGTNNLDSFSKSIDEIIGMGGSFLKEVGEFFSFVKGKASALIDLLPSPVNGIVKKASSFLSKVF